MKKSLYIFVLLFLISPFSFCQSDLTKGDGVGGWRKWKRKYNALLPQYKESNLQIDKLINEKKTLAERNRKLEIENKSLRQTYEPNSMQIVKPNVSIPDNVKPFIDEIKREQRTYANIMMQYKRKAIRYDSIYEYSYHKNVEELQDILKPLGIKSVTTQKMVTFINLTDDIFLFPTGKYELDEARVNASKLKPIVKFLNERKIRFMVEGNADVDFFQSSRCPVDNWDLSSLRATTIVRYLYKTYGIDSNIMTATGRGSTNPISFADDITDRNLLKNRDRRVDLVIYPDLAELIMLLEDERKQKINTNKPK